MTIKKPLNTCTSEDKACLLHQANLSPGEQLLSNRADLNGRVSVVDWHDKVMALGEISLDKVHITRKARRI